MRYLPPVLTGIFCTVSLYAANAARILPGEAFVAIGISVAIGLFFAGLFSLNKWTSRGAAFIASFWTAVFLLWSIITPAVGVVFLLISTFIGVKFDTKTAQKALLVVMTIAIVVSGISAIFGMNVQQVAATNAITPGTDRPNIYFIVPDRMPSIEAMVQSGIDPSEFKWALIRKGFYIVDDQMSADQYTAIDPPAVETTRTMRFFASVLNDGRNIDLKIPYRNAMNLIKNPGITNELHDLGYTFYNVGSWFSETKSINTADYNLEYPEKTLFDRVFAGEFNEAFWSRTILKGLNFRAWLPSASLNQHEGLRHVWQAMTVEEISKLPDQHFVMAHIILPHEPYVWDAEGNISYKDDPVAGYTAQIQFTCGYLLSLIENIQKNDTSAIIIIQSDEGMAYRKPVELNYDLTPAQWNGVLSAWMIPNWIKPIDKTELDALKHTEILKYVLDVVK